MIDVNTATKSELIDYGRDELGLKLDARKSEDEIRHLVAKQLGQDVSTTPAAEMSSDQKRELAKLNKQEKVKIIIFENPKHPARVQVGVNGVMYWIKPGVEVSVPKAVVGVLSTAMPKTFTQVEENGKLRMVEQQALAYPFQVLG